MPDKAYSNEVRSVPKSGSDHSFIIPAYGDSPYLEDCIASLRSQDVSSQILLTTSTPSNFLDETCRRHNIECRVNPHSGGIGSDWNFALSQCSTRYFTLAHQDDIYHPMFSTQSIEALETTPDALISFTNGWELFVDVPRTTSKTLSVKRLLVRASFLGRRSITKPSTKRRLLQFGCPISCPSVTFDRDQISQFQFSEKLKVVLDWDYWLQLAAAKGAFVWVPDALIGYRIHPQTETSLSKIQGVRAREDRFMFDKLWPAPLNRMVSALYRLSY